jgi:hypothetical protein
VDNRNEISTFQAGMFMETKVENKVSGARCQGINPCIVARNERLVGHGAIRHKSTFQAGIFMKTKGRERQRSGDQSKPVGRGGQDPAIKKLRYILRSY